MSVSKERLAPPTGRLPPPPSLSCLAWIFCSRAADSQKSVSPQKALCSSLNGFHALHLNITQTRLSRVAVKILSAPDLSHNKRKSTKCSL